MNALYDEYNNLINKVKEFYPRYTSPQTVSEKKLYCHDECKEINFYTYWQGRGHIGETKIMLVGLDWGCPWDKNGNSDMDNITKMNKGEKVSYLDGLTISGTDLNLIKLFKVIGYDDIEHNDYADLFFTNFALGCRCKTTSGNFNPSWIKDSVPFFRELVDIIKPRIIICLGKSAYGGVIKSFDSKNPVIKILNQLPYNEYIDKYNPVTFKYNDSSTVNIFAVAHCGAMGTLNRNHGLNNNLDNQKNDWEKITPFINALKR